MKNNINLNYELLLARILFDGGYYFKALDKLNTINIEDKGMVFANGVSALDWSWGAVKAIPLGEDDVAKVEGQTHKMDMSSLKPFNERDYIEALSFIGILPE